MRAMTRGLAAAMVLVGVIVAAGSPPPPKRVTPRADAGTAAKVEAPSAPGQRGPMPRCSPDCYSYCGSGAARRRDAPPTERERRCRGCRNICMDKGKSPPAELRGRLEGFDLLL